MNFRWTVTALAAAMAGLYAVTMAWPFARDYFELVVPSDSVWLTAAICMAAGGLLVAVAPRITALLLMGRVRGR